MDDVDRTFKWVCGKCGERYEENNLGSLEVRIQVHKCKEKANTLIPLTVEPEALGGKG